MTKPIQLVTTIPFCGFYGSSLSAAIDYAESNEIEYRAASDSEADREDNESYWPEPLRLDESALGNLYFRNTNYRIAYEKLGERYLEAFDNLASDALDLKTGLAFESITSPREYNFETDRLFAYIPLKVVKALFARSKAESHATLAAAIRERFTSRDGFLSRYDNRLDDWTAKPLGEWDHNEVGTLLIAALRMADADDIEGEAEESAIENEGDYQAWESAVDWKALEANRLEDRAELLVDWLESDEEEARAWLAFNPGKAGELASVESVVAAALDDMSAAIVWRCPDTLDLFGATQA